MSGRPGPADGGCRSIAFRAGNIRFYPPALQAITFCSVSIRSHYYLSVSPAVTRLTVYRRLQVRELGTLGALCRQRQFVKVVVIFVTTASRSPRR